MILVTGAKGFIGGSLMQALQLREMPAIPYNDSINNPLAIEAALEGIDTVIHLATAERRGSTRQLRFVDVTGTDRLLKQCRLAQIRRFILISRLGADANTWFPLLKVKGEQERLVKQSDLPYTIIRSATLYGHRDHFLNHIVGLAAWSYPFLLLPRGGKTPLQPLWVEDLVRGILHVLTRYDLIGKLIEVAGEERMSFEKMAIEALITAGISRKPIAVPPWLLKNINRISFGWWRYPPVSNFILERLAVADIADLDSIHHHFGFRPARFSQTIAYLRRSGHRWRLLR